MRKIISDSVVALTRKSQARFQYIVNFYGHDAGRVRIVVHHFSYGLDAGRVRMAVHREFLWP